MNLKDSVFFGLWSRYLFHYTLDIKLEFGLTGYKISKILVHEFVYQHAYAGFLLLRLTKSKSKSHTL